MANEPQVKFTVTETVELPLWFIKSFVNEVGSCGRIEQIKYIRNTFPEKQLGLRKSREIAIQIEQHIDQTRMDKLAVVGYDFSKYSKEELIETLDFVNIEYADIEKEIKAIEAELRLRGVECQQQHS